MTSLVCLHLTLKCFCSKRFLIHLPANDLLALLEVLYYMYYFQPLLFEIKSLPKEHIVQLRDPLVQALARIYDYHTVG